MDMTFLWSGILFLQAATFVVASPAHVANRVEQEANAGAVGAARGNESRQQTGPSYIDFPIEKLKDQVPELVGLEPVSSQERLPLILNNMAQTIAGVVPRLPDLVSHEEVYRAQSTYGPSTPQGMLGVSSAGGSLSAILTAQAPRGMEFRYLILCHRAPGGGVALEESRTDIKGHPIDFEKKGAVRLGSGFAYQWLLFAGANQEEFRFRYLGEQDIDDRKTAVVAFAQIPNTVKMPAIFQSNGKQAPYFYQGILWIDAATSNIVLLRSDLLEPLKSLHLQELTTEVHFHSVTIHDFDGAFWLPSEVHIHIDQETLLIEEEHQYSDYHLYHSTARILP